MTWSARRMDCSRTSAWIAALVALPVSLIFAQNTPPLNFAPENPSGSSGASPPMTPAVRAAGPPHHYKPNFPLEDKGPQLSGGGPTSEQPIASASGYAPSYGGGGGYSGPHSA